MPRRQLSASGLSPRQAKPSHSCAPGFASGYAACGASDDRQTRARPVPCRNARPRHPPDAAPAAPQPRSCAARSRPRPGFPTAPRSPQSAPENRAPPCSVSTALSMKVIQPRQRRRLAHALMRQAHSRPAPHRSPHLPIGQIIRRRPDLWRPHRRHRRHRVRKSPRRHRLPERRIDLVIATLPGRHLPRLDQQRPRKAFGHQPLGLQRRLHGGIARHRLRIIHPLPHHPRSPGFGHQPLQHRKRIAAPQDQPLAQRRQAFAQTAPAPTPAATSPQPPTPRPAHPAQTPAPTAAPRPPPPPASDDPTSRKSRRNHRIKG